MNGNRNTKSNREAIWKDLKSWTKNVDIFKKKILVFPINDALHWTVCIVCNPGRLLRRFTKEFIKKKTDLTLKHKQLEEEREEEKKKERWAKLDSSSPLADTTGVAPLSLLPILNGDNRPVQESGQKIVADTTPSTPPADDKIWQCCFCPSQFNSFELALEHESICDENIDWCMIHFDSGKHFKLHKSTEVLGNIRKYLNAAASEHESIQPRSVLFTTKNMPGFSAAVPQQDNAKDCGVYMLEMAERMMRNPPHIDNEFVKNKGASKNNFFGNNSFGKNVIVQKREDIHQLIQRLRREETCL